MINFLKMLKGLKFVPILGPLVSTEDAFKNEATSYIRLAYLPRCRNKHKVKAKLVDISDLRLNRIWSNKTNPTYICQGEARE